VSPLLSIELAHLLYISFLRSSNKYNNWSSPRWYSNKWYTVGRGKNALKSVYLIPKSLTNIRLVKM
jgi:hypothetical protein